MRPGSTALCFYLQPRKSPYLITLVNTLTKNCNMLQINDILRNNVHSAFALIISSMLNLVNKQTLHCFKLCLFQPNVKQYSFVEHSRAYSNLIYLEMVFASRNFLDFVFSITNVHLNFIQTNHMMLVIFQCRQRNHTNDFNEIKC